LKEEGEGEGEGEGERERESRVEENGTKENEYNKRE